MTWLQFAVLFVVMQQLVTGVDDIDYSQGVAKTHRVNAAYMVIASISFLKTASLISRLTILYPASLQSPFRRPARIKTASFFGPLR